jgi:hypothetical protein
MPQMRPGRAVSQPDHVTQSCLGLEPPMSSIFAWFSLSWPKTNYLKDPLGVLDRRRWRNMKNTK